MCRTEEAEDCRYTDEDIPDNVHHALPAQFLTRTFVLRLNAYMHSAGTTFFIHLPPALVSPETTSLNPALSDLIGGRAKTCGLGYRLHRAYCNLGGCMTSCLPKGIVQHEKQIELRSVALKWLFRLWQVHSA